MPCYLRFQTPWILREIIPSRLVDKYRYLKNKIPTWCHLLYYFTSYVFNMFRTLIYPSSGACNYSVEVPHWSCVLGSMCVGDSVWLPEACNTDTTPTQPHRISNTHRTTYKTTNVVFQQNSRKLLMMDTLMSETCWAHKLWNKIASNIKLVFYSSTITMMHGPINISIDISEQSAVSTCRAELRQNAGTQHNASRRFP